MYNFSVTAEAADAQAPLVAGASAGLVMTNYGSSYV